MGNATINITNDSKISQLKALLYLLQSNLEELKDEVDMSYELLKVGEKTELLKKLEEKINNPIEDLLQFSNTIDAQVRQILHKIIQGLFKKNSNIIDKVYKTRSSINDLHYSIVLREDTMENRNVLFDFLNKFDFDNLNQKHNIYFQFIPAHLIDKIKFSEELPLS
ncbi:MAG TPA: hypothetical protein VKX31_02920 [Brumimicrobium sp.]|nr:hypothetical protein [Brumimicrobium sp.]